MGLRNGLIVVVGGFGVAAITATSQVATEPVFVVESPEKQITVVLDEAQPELRFLVDVTSTVEGEPAVVLRSQVTVANDDDVANDGLALLDVGLVDPATALPLQVEVGGDASLAAVPEGVFGIEKAVDGQLVLAARKRDSVASVRVSFVLVASTTVFADTAPRSDETLALEVSPDVAPSPEGGQ